MILAQNDLTVSCNYTLQDLTPSQWNLPIFSQPLLDYDFLAIIEESKVNNLQHFYFQLFNSQEETIGRANAYMALTDFATLESGTPPALIKLMQGIKKLYPRFLAFNMLECGFFTTLGEGIEVSQPQQKPVAIQALAQHLETLTKAHQVGFHC